MTFEEPKIAATLVGHRKPIATLDISPDGNSFISGDDDGLLCVWDLKSYANIQEIHLPVHGAITVAKWFSAIPGADPLIVFGCADGSLHVYQKANELDKFSPADFVDAHISAVEDIAVEMTSKRLATVGGGVARVWQLNPQENTISEYSTPTVRNPYIAKSVQFFNSGQSLLVFFLESHEVVAYSVDPLERKWSKKLQTRIGDAFYCVDNNLFLISNLANGIDAYAIPPSQTTLQQVQNYRSHVRCNVALDVVTAMQGNWVISGSDDGTVRIFDQRSATLMYSLRHGDPMELVQAVAVYSDANQCIIISGSSSPGEADVKIWRSYPISARAQPAVKIEATPAPMAQSTSAWSIRDIAIFVLTISFCMNMFSSQMPKLSTFMMQWLAGAMPDNFGNRVASNDPAFNHTI